MPTAGDEGYEKLVKCPYDKAHEIRKGRMQFHLEKCRRNFPTTSYVDCPYNKGHVVLKEELNYHMEEECESRVTWDRFSHEQPTDCPVKDLVPVNAATVPDGGENWDNVEIQGSVLNHIKTEAEKKPIHRMCQTLSKAKRRAFRISERNRFSALEEEHKGQPKGSVLSDPAPVVSEQYPLPKPRRLPNVPVIKQDPNQAVAAIQKQFRSLDLNMKPSTAEVAPSESSSMVNGPPSEFETASTSRQQMSYAAASSSSTANRPPSAMSFGNSSTSMMTALNTTSRPSSVSSYATASALGAASRPHSALSNSSAGNTSASSVMSFNGQRPPNSNFSRPSTALSIAASAASYNRGEDGFCQIPIPGLGRGKRRPVQ